MRPVKRLTLGMVGLGRIVLPQRAFPLLPPGTKDVKKRVFYKVLRRTPEKWDLKVESRKETIGK
jgi:hypothetical protein